MGSYPWLGAKTSPGDISKTQICHISYHLFSYTYPLLTAIKFQAWLPYTLSSLYPQFRWQPLTSLDTLVADKSFLYEVVISSGANIVNSCRAWSRLCVSFQKLSGAVEFSGNVFQHSQPSEEQEPALPERTSLTHGEIFVKLLLEGSNATNYLHGASQPSRQFDRWLWPQQTWGPSIGWHIHLLLKGEVDGLRCGYEGCKACSQIASCSVPASGRHGQINYPDGIILRDPCECTHAQ